MPRSLCSRSTPETSVFSHWQGLQTAISPSGRMSRISSTTRRVSSMVTNRPIRKHSRSGWRVLSLAQSDDLRVELLRLSGSYSHDQADSLLGSGPIDLK